MILGISWLGWSLPFQVIFNGAVLGLGYAVIAAGLLLIYRSSSVVNFAQAALGAFGAQIFAMVAVDQGVNYWIGLLAGVAAAGAVAGVVELVVVRRLFNASRVVLFIATVGVSQLIVAIITVSLPQVQGRIDPAFTGDWAEWEPFDWLRVGNIQASVILLVVPLLLLLGLFLTKTRFGLHIRGVADSPENAQLVGVSPRQVSTIVWVIAGALAGFTQIVTAGGSAVATLGGVSSIGLLLRALLVALIARMRSMPLVVVGGLLVGAAEAVVAVNLTSNPGIIDLFILLAVLALVLSRVATSRNVEDRLAIGVRVSAIPEHVRPIGWIRTLPKAGMAVLFGFFLIVPPLVFSQPSEMLVWTRVLLIAAVAMSASILIGWAGQLSLGQMAFAGVGGMTTLVFDQGFEFGVGVLGHTWFNVSWNLPWLLALVVGTLVGVAMAVGVGIPALRVRGLFLAITTLAFAAMVSGWLFLQDGFNGGSTTISRQTRPKLGSWLDFAPPRTFYYLCLAFVALVAVVLSQFRKTGSGRRIIAVRDNEEMTAASTVSPTLAKLSAFAVSGGVAAMAGGLIVYLEPGFSLSETSPFATTQSIRVVAIAIIGGLGTIAGPILGALWVIGVPALRPDWDFLDFLAADIGLLLLLLYFPGGFIQVLYTARDAIVRWATENYRDRLVPKEQRRVTAIPLRERDFHLPPEGEPWLQTEDVSVTFGGLRAVDEVSMQVGEGELVGLIGTNGAGKSTLMNAISGFVPATGRIHVLGSRIDNQPAANRPRVGLGRGFQDAGLFPGLTVRETVLVALEARESSLLVPSLLRMPPSPASERRKRSEADDIIDFLGLGSFADNFIADLSTGTRRIVELACLIATNAKVLLLDEPTGGVAQRETEAFAPLILRVKRELGAAVVVIEHDMPLIMSISDRVYCLEAGAVIAEGLPDDVRDNPLVIASYLGTDERAITRSNQ